jgi:ABC-type phosphate/phosphonate transport system ATPase subunit
MRIVMIGHSASGKSATLKCLGINRSTNDMDLFILQQRLSVDVSSFQKLLRADNGDRLFVLSNEPKLMSDLIAARAVGEL